MRYLLVLHWLLASFGLHIGHAVVGHHHKRVHNEHALNDFINPTFEAIEDIKFLSGMHDNPFAALTDASGAPNVDPSRRCLQAIDAYKKLPDDAGVPWMRTPPQNWRKKEIVRKGVYSIGSSDSDIEKPKKSCGCKAKKPKCKLKNVDKTEKKKSEKKRVKCPCRKKLPYPKVKKTCPQPSSPSSPAASKSCRPDPCSCCATPPPLPFNPPACPKPPKKPGSKCPSNSRPGTSGKSPLFYSVDSPQCTCMFGSINVPPCCGSSPSCPPCSSKIDDKKLRELLSKSTSDGTYSMTVLQMPKPPPCCPPPCGGCCKPKSREEPPTSSKATSGESNPDPACVARDADKELKRIIKKYENLACKREEICKRVNRPRVDYGATFVGSQVSASTCKKSRRELLTPVEDGEQFSDVRDVKKRSLQSRGPRLVYSVGGPQVSASRCKKSRRGLLTPVEDGEQFSDVRDVKKRSVQSRGPRLVYSVGPGVFGMVNVQPGEFEQHRPEVLPQPPLTRNAAERGMPYRRTKRMRKLEDVNERRNGKADDTLGR